MWKICRLFIASSVLVSTGAAAEGIAAKFVKDDLSKKAGEASVWAGAKEETLTLMAQPMVPPKPAETMTQEVKVKAVHDGKLLAVQIRWKDAEPSYAGKLGKFSDGVAIQFPVKEGDPPAIFMGSKGEPVQILNWKAQYQQDREKGMATIKDIYPNGNSDIYPYNFKVLEGDVMSNDMKKIVTAANDKADYGEKHKPGEAGGGFPEQLKEMYQHGQAAGNSNSFPKKNGVAELRAEGFSTSSVIADTSAAANGDWKDGEWTVTITRPMKQEGAGTFVPGGATSIAFAVWQGDKGEVGGRKSLTMMWTPVAFEK